jgi:eukaryotic-like serine/threonine-protein kinase
MSAPRRVGPYRIVRSLGTGGMGTVYLGERDDERFEVQVAVKLLRSSLVGTDLAGRFRRERQILAELSHPGIARLLDGGETDEGVPYLVMEYVDGTPIDEFVRRSEVGLSERLELFLKVCDAVRHAHARLIVHTDLKPANILVSGEGWPTLLDFGIAKLLAEPDTDPGSPSAATVLRPLTPAYSSPEQIRGEPIATSTDVYSLGVLLYELVTGTLPYPSPAREGRALEEAILYTDPQPPSRRTDPTLAGSSSTWSSAGHPRIDRDLDTIVLKALAKDPTRRYASVDRLADDLERYLLHQPVLARPDSWTYRAGKFARRHRGSVGGAVATLASVVGFGVVSLALAAQVAAERNEALAARGEAQAVTDFLVEVFDATDPGRAQGLDLTAREILGTGGIRMRTELGDQPAVQGAVALAIGEAYRGLGAPDSAGIHLAFAAEAWREAHGARSVPRALALEALGRIQLGRGQFEEAEGTLAEALSIALDVAGPDALETATVWNATGNVRHARSQLEAAEAAFREALRIREAALGPSHPETAIVLNNLGLLYTDAGRFEEGIEYSRQALEAYLALHGDTPHLEVAYSTNNLASTLETAGRFDEAEPLYLRSMEIREALLDSDHPHVTQIKNNLGTLYIRTGRLEEAVPLLAEVVATHRRRGLEPADLGAGLNNYGTALHRSGRPAEAIDALRESEAIFVELQGSDAVVLAFPRQTLGDALAALVRTEEAEAVYRSALDVRERGLPEDHPNVAFTRNKLGTFLLDEGRLAEAEALLEPALQVRLAALSEGHPDLVDSNLQMGRLRAAQGRTDEAADFLRRAIEEGTAARGEDDPGARRARALLAEIGG